MATMQTNTLAGSLSELSSFNRSHRLTPSGFSSESDLMMDCRKQSIAIRSRPIVGHWDPIPEKTNHTGRVPPITFCTATEQRPVQQNAHLVDLTCRQNVLKSNYRCRTAPVGLC